MAKKHQSRPSAAARKKYEEKKLAERIASRKKLFEKYKKQILIGGAALIAAVIVIVLAVDFFYAPNGSMRVFLGNVMGAVETSVIREIDDLYYEMARMETPDGYTPEPYQLFVNGETQERNRYFITDDESRAIQSLYVTGVKSKTAAEMIETVMKQSSSYTFQGEAKQAEIAGHPVHYLYVQNVASDEDNSIMSASLLIYVDSVADSSVLFSCTSGKMLQEELPAEEVLLAEAESLMTGLTVFTK